MKKQVLFIDMMPLPLLPNVPTEINDFYYKLNQKPKKVSFSINWKINQSSFLKS